MTADQEKKLHQVANALARSGLAEGLPGAADTIEWAVETIREVIAEPHPFTTHWRNDE
jgi:hypothetical protein